MKLIIVVLLMLLLSSCESKVNYKEPENLIPKDKMTDLLYDMHLAVGTSNVKNINLEKNRNYMSLVYEKYGVDSTQFAMSNIYYTSKIKEYEEIFKEVEVRLKKIRVVYQSQRDSMIEASRGTNQIQKPKDSLRMMEQMKK